MYIYLNVKSYTMETKSKLRILIVEDDLVLAASLEENLNELGYISIDKVKDAQAALKVFNNTTPDLAILDIRLENSSLDGIEIAQRFNAIKKIPLLFLSSYDDETIRERAKDVQPSAFLVKPASVKQIDIAIEFALNSFYAKAVPRKGLERVICPLGNKPEFVFIRGNLSYEKVLFHDITHLVAAASSSIVNTCCKKFAVSTNLQSLLDQLNHEQIIRVHRSYAINLAHLHSFDEHDVYILQNNEVIELPIGNAYKSAFLEMLPKIKTKR